MSASGDHICAEIEYGATHSDLCADSVERLADPDYRDLLHRALDEWLDRSEGNGIFYIGEPGRFAQFDDPDEQKETT